MPIRNADGSRRNPTQLHTEVGTARQLIAALHERFDYGDDSPYAPHISLDGETVPTTDIESLEPVANGQARVRLKNGKVMLVGVSALVGALIGARLLIRHKKS